MTEMASIAEGRLSPFPRQQRTVRKRPHCTVSLAMEISHGMTGMGWVADGLV